MSQALQTVELQTGESPRAAVVWLHGLGADGTDFVPIVPELGLRDARFVFPHAPVRAVTLNNGMRMRAWFDLYSLDTDDASRMFDAEGLAESVAAVEELIGRQLAAGIDASRIVVAGFSQGGVTALAAALAYPQRLAGIIGLSTWAPIARVDAAAANHATPVFLAHGDFDPVVPVALGVQTRDLLQAAGMDVAWNTYPMAHAVCPQQIRDIAAFLHRVLGAA